MPLTLRVFSTFAVGCLTASSLALHAQQTADTVLLHGKVYTENAAQPWTQAVAIKDGRIEATGSDAEIAKYRGPATQVIDGSGHLVLPGFVDSHVHFIGGSLSLQTVALDTAETIAEIQKRVKEFAAAHPEQKVITGFGWMYPVFGRAALPDKKYLDEVVPDRPVVLTAYDYHTTWANSKAMQLAGITRDTPNPLNGVIVRDPSTGEATGALKEAAGELVSKLEPKKTDEEVVAAVAAGIKLANSFGITRVHSAGGDGERIEIFDQLRKRNLLTLRFYFALFAEPPEVTPKFIEQAEALRRNYHDEWLAGGAIKFFSDGVIESHTAAMLEPYSDDPATSGHLNWTPEHYREAVTELDRRGFQIFTHSIGDQGIRLSLDMMPRARPGVRDSVAGDTDFRRGRARRPARRHPGLPDHAARFAELR
jgi:predicted amidohydrolase YtcJ